MNSYTLLSNCPDGGGGESNLDIFLRFVCKPETTICGAPYADGKDGKGGVGEIGVEVKESSSSASDVFANPSKGRVR